MNFKDSKEVKSLMDKCISESVLRIDPQSPSLTVPRSFGVYEIAAPGSSKKFRFGNHPVREHELTREFGSVKRIGLFLERDKAVTLAKALNS